MSEFPRSSSSFVHSEELSIIPFSSLALLGPGAFSSPSDVMRLCDICFGKWSGKAGVSILIVWISSVC